MINTDASHLFPPRTRPARRGGGPLEAAFDRVVSQDPLLGPLAGRHWLHRDRCCWCCGPPPSMGRQTPTG